MRKNLKFAEYLFFIILFFLSIRCSKSIAVKESDNYNAEGKKLFERVSESGIPWSVWSKSAEGRDIPLLELGRGEDVTLIMGGFHGNELLGTKLVLKFTEYLFEEIKYAGNVKVVLLPVINPDGLIRGTRVNKNGVDINRNFPTENWTGDGSRFNAPGAYAASEPETKAVMQLLEKYKPKRIVSVHTPLEVVNYDGPALELANAMAKHNGYPVSGYIGYATPGSFGTYAGVERNIPVITLELPVKDFSTIWEQNREALMETLNGKY